MVYVFGYQCDGVRLVTAMVTIFLKSLYRFGNQVVLLIGIYLSDKVTGSYMYL